MSANASWAKFNWEDPFLFEDQLTEEERMIRDSRTCSTVRSNCSRAFVKRSRTNTPIRADLP